MPVGEKRGMKQAQAMIITILITLLAFSVIITLFITQWASLKDHRDKFVDYEVQSNNIGDILMSEPYPKQWEENTVKKIGLIEEDKITDKNLLKFSTIDYPDAKKMLGLEGEFIVYFEEKDGTPINFQGSGSNGDWQYFGWNGKDVDYNGGSSLEEVSRIILNNSKTVAKTDRIVLLQKDGITKSVNMIIYVWDFSRGQVTLDTWNPFEEFEFSVVLFTNSSTYERFQRVSLTD